MAHFDILGLDKAVELHKSITDIIEQSQQSQSIIIYTCSTKSIK